MADIALYRPLLKELSFRQSLLSDPATMSYNHAWGGTISFPPERWAEWYERWVAYGSAERFYRYLWDEGAGCFVGEVSYHWDDGFGAYICDIIVAASCRGRGIGAQGLALLCQAAKANGVDRLCDDIAADNPSVQLFLRAGFREISRNETYVLVEKKL